MLAALGVSPAALAHYPHDMAYWVAVSPDPAEPRLATSLERIDLEIMGRSENGLDWDARLIQATIDGEVPSAAFLTSTRLAVATSQRGLQVSDDAGDTLVRSSTVSDSAITRVVPSPAILTDGLAFVTGETSVWRTQDSGITFQAVQSTLDEGFTDVDVSPDFMIDGRVCAVERTAMSCSQDHGDTWRRTLLPQGTFRTAVGAGHRVWATVRGEGVYLSADDGTTWALSAFPGEDVTAIAEFQDGLVLAAKSLQAEWRSTDGGATWTEVPVYQVVIDQTRDGVTFFDFIQGPDGTIYLTNWFGLAVSHDAGLTYTYLNTEPIQNTHWVTVTEGLGGALSAWVGTYGGGPFLLDLATLETEVYPSLTKRYTRSAPATSSWDRDGAAIFDEGYCTWRTRDYGQTWQRIAQDPNSDGEMEMTMDVKGVALAPDTSVDPFVVANIGQNAMTFQTSDDLGDTWLVGTQEPGCENIGFAAGISPRWPDDSRAWASCGGAVYETMDRGASWTAIGDTGAWIFRFAEQTDGALLVATSNGLWRIEGSSTTQIAFDGLVVDSVVASTEEGDDTVFALVPTEGWMRSTDGGDSWVELPRPTADMPRMIAMSPTYAEDGAVAVAGYGGAWASRDRGESWFSIYTTEVYETSHDAWLTTGTWSQTFVEEASSAEVMLTTEVGASKTLEFRGVAITLEAPPSPDPGVIGVWLDDVRSERVTLPTSGTTVWHADDLPDTWHTLRIEALLGTVALDDVVITRRTEPVDRPDSGGPDDTARPPGDTADTGTDPRLDPSEVRGCSCQRGGSASLLLLPLLLARRRRWAR